MYHVIAFKHYYYIYHDIIVAFISNNIVGCLYYNQTKITRESNTSYLSNSIMKDMRRARFYLTRSWKMMSQ